MKFNKIILIGLLLFAIISLGAVSATDDMNTADGNDILSAQTTSDIANNLAIENTNVKDEISEVNSNDMQNKEVLSDGNAPIVISNKTFTNYFDGEGKLLDSVAEGSILDFQGSIIASDSVKAIYIDKAVSIVSSTGDAMVMLNSHDVYFDNEHITGRFIVKGVSSINIENITFKNTQLLIYDSNNVILKNINVLADISIVPTVFNQRTIGFVRLGNLTNVCVKDNYFNIVNSKGSYIDCADVNNVCFDGNRFEGYLGDIIEGYSCIFFSNFVDSTVNLTNNYCNLTCDNFATIYASNILFENNTFMQQDINAIASSIVVNLGESDKSNVIVRNNVVPNLNLKGNATVYNNYVKYMFSCTGSLLMHDNVVGSNLGISSLREITLYSNSIFYNNTVNGTIEIRGNNVILKESNIKSIVFVTKMRNITVVNNNINGEDIKYFRAITVKSTETYISNNTIKGVVSIEDPGNCEIKDNVINGEIVIKSKSSIIQNNVIYSSDRNYVITIPSDSYYILNEIYGNKLYSRIYCGENAISYDEKYLNYIEKNTPSTQINMFVNTTVTTFDYGDDITIEVSMLGVEGNVTIDVDGQKYSVKLVNGVASQVITKYNLGINNVSIIYEDIVNDAMGINFTSFTVNKVTVCPIKLIYDKNVEKCESSEVKVILPDDANGTIALTVTDGVYTVDIEQDAIGSENIIALAGLFEGNYNISATFTSIKYVTNSSSSIISFVHVPVCKLIAEDVVMDYKDGSKYTVLVTKDDVAVGAGEVVNIVFNGVSRSVKTDENGYATLTLDGAPKTYTIKAEYNGVTYSTKVTIKNILTASNVSKKKAKQIKFSATLKNSKGKAISGKITFKFKGKTYTAKTNKKGVATITLKNLKVGKYSITSKYGTCIVKSTIKIKK